MINFLTSMADIPKTGIVIFHNGAFGGATKRIANLFFHVDKLYPGRFYLIVNRNLFEQLQEIYETLPSENIRVLETSADKMTKPAVEHPETPKFYADSIADPMDVDKQHTIARKIYWFAKNKNRYRKLFRKIDALRAGLDIKVFYGVSAGVLPLVFYLNESPARASVIFSDMDSWFTDVHRDMKKLWYRKYYSYNYALENSSLVDFLSPYIAEGVREHDVNIKEERIRIAPCSFIDYSKCSPSEKSKIEVAFCSRLEADKNPMLYLDAAKEVLQKFPDIKFHILGEGTLVNEISGFIEKNNLKNSINFQFHKNPPEIFKDTSIFISLQTGTNYPSQSVLEAMACGNAVIASNRGDTNLFINEKNGILIEPEKVPLVRAIENLVLNPDKNRTMGMNGREMVLKEHTIERFTEYFLSLVREAGNIAEQV